MWTEWVKIKYVKFGDVSGGGYGKTGRKRMNSGFDQNIFYAVYEILKQ